MAGGSEKITFGNRGGKRLAARLEQSIGAPRAYPPFAHGFARSKDADATSRISRAVAGCGFAVVRFHLTGRERSLVLAARARRGATTAPARDCRPSPPHADDRSQDPHRAGGARCVVSPASSRGFSLNGSLTGGS